MAIDYTKYKEVYKNKRILPFKRNESNKSKFLFRVDVNKKPYRKVFTAIMDTPSNMIDQAIREYDKFIEEKKNQRGCKVSVSINMQDFFDIWFDQKKAGWGTWHIKNIKGSYNNYIKPEIAEKKVKDVLESDITRILDRAADKSRRTRKGITEVLTPLFAQAIEERLVSVSPVKQKHKVKRKAREEKRVVLNAEGKYLKIYKTINKRFEFNPKLRALFLMGFYGRRVTEVLKMQWSDISLEAKQYQIRGEDNKVNTDMIFQLPDEVAEAFKEMLPDADCEYVFSSNIKQGDRIKDVSCHYQGIRDDSGIEEFTFHWMRNLSTSALSSMGVEEVHLSALLGHTDTSTVRQYLTLQRQASSQHAMDKAKDFLGS